MAQKDKKPVLGKLFGSNARVKILKLFLIHAEKRFYIRQISRELKLPLNSVRRELVNLEKFGLLISHGKSKDNGDWPIAAGTAYEVAKREIVNEKILAKGKKTKSGKRERGWPSLLKTAYSKHEKKFYMANKDFVLYEEIKAMIMKAQILYEKDFAVKIQKAGQVKLLILTGIFVNEPNSIIDILAVGKFDRQKFLRVISELENELGREVNYSLMDTKEFKYRRDITDVFLYSVFEGKKFVVIDEVGAF